MIELSLERHSRDTVLKLYSLYRTVMKTKANLISYQFVILDSFNVHFLNDPIFQKKNNCDLYWSTKIAFLSPIKIVFISLISRQRIEKN